MQHKTVIRVMMVCLGNICRSPLAEVIMRQKAQQLWGDVFHIESSGTGDWHLGGAADKRSAITARQYGLDLSQHRAQQITARMIPDWDYLVAMDRSNQQSLQRMGAKEEQLFMMRHHEQNQDVPDPYYGGSNGFEQVYQMLDRNAEQLLQTIHQHHQQGSS